MRDRAKARSQAADKVWNIYDRVFLSKPVLSLAVLAAVTAFFCIGIKDFRLDASSDTLILEHDEDLRYFRAMSARYESGDFVIVTYTPPEDLFSEASLARLKTVREELRALPRVTSVVTILDVPLLRNPPGDLKDLKDNIKTLESPNVDMKFAIEEFRTSPIYQNLLVGEDMSSTAILVNFEVEKSDQELVNRRIALREKRYVGELSPVEKTELAAVETRYRVYKDEAAARRTSDVKAIRGVIHSHSEEAQFFLGGIPMIVEDIMSFIRNDLIFFGAGMLGFVMLTLYMIYRRIRWVLLPVSCCVTAVMVMMGGMGFAHWDVTVVSSNFVSLQLILTMSLAIHLVSRYRELLMAKPDTDNRKLVLEATRQTFIPCLYANLTTIAGFNSLIFCDILPVIQFGWIMSLGLVVSLIVVFWLLPAGIASLTKPAAEGESEWGAPLTFFFARFVDRHRALIFVVSIGLILVEAVGISRLKVENSFINYFRKSTDIYQGMKFIDEKLGGTTPIDIVIKLGIENTEKGEEPQIPPPEADPGDGDDDFDDFGEFEEEAANSSKYWYTTSRLATIERVHDYLDELKETGKVMSLATLYKTALDMNSGKPFDDFSLALLFNAMGADFEDFLIKPYVMIDRDEARITARIKDSMPSLRRSELITRIKRDLVSKVGLREDQFRVSGIMVLYNNMLQSLFSSQIKAIGGTMTVLMLMFLTLFRSFKISLVILIPQFVACLSVLGIMGLGGIPLDIMTITIVSIAMGIGVDNAIHYTYRFQQEIKKDRDYVRSMYSCHITIGNAMLYTSLSFTAGFSILVFSNFIPSILFGLLTGTAMVVAAASSQALLPALILYIQPFGPGRTDVRS